MKDKVTPTPEDENAAICLEIPGPILHAQGPPPGYRVTARKQGWDVYILSKIDWAAVDEAALCSADRLRAAFHAEGL